MLDMLKPLRKMRGTKTLLLPDRTGLITPDEIQVRHRHPATIPQEGAASASSLCAWARFNVAKPSVDINQTGRVHNQAPPASAAVTRSMRLRSTST